MSIVVYLRQDGTIKQLFKTHCSGLNGVVQFGDKQPIIGSLVAMRGDNDKCI